MIRFEQIALSAGTQELLRDATFHLRPAIRVGLIGRNGAGKSTLLRAILGEHDVDEGKIYRRSDLQLGYLPQQAVSGSTLPLWDEARSRMTRFLELEARLHKAQADVEAHAEGAVERLTEATEAFRMAGGYAIDERIGEVLHGLGFEPEDWQRTCETFSGGWQMRIALARLLLSEPNVLLLDEPTNHLDITARSWLAGYLERYPHAVLIVSHDRHLLDRICTHIVEIRRKQLTTFTGNYSAWLRERDLRDDQALSAFESQKTEIARLERFVERFGAKATKAAQAKSRQKVIDRMDRLDAPEREGKPKFLLPEAPGCSQEVLALRGASVGWEVGKPVLSGIDFTLDRGQRVAVLGPNGCGKSTLLKSLIGRIPLLAGKRRVGKDVRLGVFDQDLAQELPMASTALEVVLAAAPAATPQRARSALGALGLHGDMALRPIAQLSGGERARVALACFSVREVNVLLLDEPTNHLDVVTVDVLVEALRVWNGAMLLVTHDRWVVEQLATHVVVVAPGRIDYHEGLRPSDFEPITDDKVEEVDRTASDDYADRKRKQRERERAGRRVETLGGEIEAAEANVHRLEELLFAHAADPKRSRELLAEQRQAEAMVASLYAEWEELEGLL